MPITDRFLDQVDALDAAMRTAFATMSLEQRKLLTYHDAYAYFAEHYGWDVVGAIQVDNFEEPSAKEVAALIGQVKSEGVKAIFGSEVFPSPVLAQIGKKIDASLWGPNPERSLESCQRWAKEAPSETKDDGKAHKKGQANPASL